MICSSTLAAAIVVVSTGAFLCCPSIQVDVLHECCRVIRSEKPLSKKKSSSTLDTGVFPVFFNSL